MSCVAEASPPDALASLAAEIRACQVCAAHLPLGPRPVFRASATARLLIAGQAPGTKVHETGIPWNDPSGERLRGWLRMDRDTFYDESRIAIVPMGFCYPGRLPNGGDAPPRPECATLWRDRLLALMPEIRLTLLVGGYALAHVLGRGAMTEHVRGFRAYLPRLLRAAASVVAHHRLGAAQSLVRRGGAAGVARGSCPRTGGPGAISLPATPNVPWASLVESVQNTLACAAAMSYKQRSLRATR